MCFCLLSLLFLAVIIKYDVSLPTKKVTGILLLIVISGSLFSACQFAYKDAKNKNAFSPYILASRFATYTPFFNLNYFALAAKEHQRLLSIANTVPYFQLSVRDTGIDTYVLIVGSLYVSTICLCMDIHALRHRKSKHKENRSNCLIKQ